VYKDGYLFISGRIKDLVIVHGVNVYPHDVEEAIHGSALAFGVVRAGGGSRC
jgi:acyl-CoA synthetase (AMP-forming)/AMP-acid ligase II